MVRGHGRYPHINGSASNTQADTAILRHPLLGDVHFRHDLDPRHQQVGQFTAGLEDFFEHPVNAKTYHQRLFEGFDMNIRGTFFDGFRQQGINQPDHRRIVVGVQQIFGVRQLFGQGI